MYVYGPVIHILSLSIANLSMNRTNSFVVD